MGVLTVRPRRAYAGDGHGQFEASDRLLRPGPPRGAAVEAAQTERSVSELVNAAVRRDLEEDARDRAEFDARREEPDLDFETVVEAMKRRGAL